jgi:hypothetical protein
MEEIFIFLAEGCGEGWEERPGLKDLRGQPNGCMTQFPAKKGNKTIRVKTGIGRAHSKNIRNAIEEYNNKYFVFLIWYR